ncbi:sensor histidine kinase [Aquincola sp. S2]|uniref:histidine kinase n=1 Tax=Pseudaquabacterium terrae TaxID=2732868 RepID=A0ABX2EF46_9BURK|nr:sensor histidine kinase [Aquabacterium terrae]NRF67250.1 sensor histidine kinase [Aquabacterium terrae]
MSATLDLDPPALETLPPACCQALAALGDAVALVHRRSATLRWISPAWRALLPTIGAGASLAAVDAALPALLSAETPAPQRLILGDAFAGDAQLVPFDAEHRLLRLADRREQGRALQRQLDDREQLLFTSRVISVGEMATTLAHELNQPIGAAANLLRGLRARLARRALQAEETDALGRAIEQVMFASRVIGRIREFTHSHQPRHVRVDVVALVRACASLLDWDLRRSGATLTLDLPDMPVRVRGDVVMLQQVVVNLMRNALDALRSDPPPKPQLSLRLFVRERDVELQVRDNGCGLADDAAARLFVPFASSKPNGMGIGLSICRSFVELHQGRLWFSRNPERGATFHLGLPLLAEAAKENS